MEDNLEIMPEVGKSLKKALFVRKLKTLKLQVKAESDQLSS